METFLPLAMHLIEPGHLNWPQMLTKMTVNPAKVLGIDRGTLQPGKVADVTVIDPKAKWTIDKPHRSRGAATRHSTAGRSPAARGDHAAAR